VIEINRRRNDHDGRDNRIDPTHHRTRAADHLSRRHRRPLLGVRDGHQTFVATFEAGGRYPGRRGHSHLPGRGGGGGGGRPLPVQQMITRIMTVLASSPLSDTSPVRATLASRREPKRRRTPITGAHDRGPHIAGRAERVGVGGVVLVEHAARIRAPRPWDDASCAIGDTPLPACDCPLCGRSTCERWIVRARRDAPFPFKGHPRKGLAGSGGRTPAPQRRPHRIPRRIPDAPAPTMARCPGFV
jgi:hypothetical protein